MRFPFQLEVVYYLHILPDSEPMTSYQACIQIITVTLSNDNVHTEVLALLQSASVIDCDSLTQETNSGIVTAGLVCPGFTDDGFCRM